MDTHASDRPADTRHRAPSSPAEVQPLEVRPLGVRPLGLHRRLLSEPPRPGAIRRSPRARWYVVAAVCVGAFMGQLDVSIVTVALPRIGADLHADPALVQWVALAYLLALVCALAAVGALADRVGRKLLYTYGFAVFTVGSALCSIAPTLGWLVAARVLQGLGAAMLQANSVALIAETLPKRELARGIGVQGAAQAVGLALGPAIGGLLLAAGGWQLIFLVNVPAGVVGIALGWLLLPRSSARARRGHFDALGAALMALALGALMLLISLARAPLGAPIELPLGLQVSLPKLALAALALVAGIILVARERRVRAPILDLRLLRRPAVAIGLGCALASYLVMFGTLYVIPYYLSASHVSSGSAGLRLASLPVALGIAAPLAGRAAAHVRGPLLGGVGLALAAAGLFGLAASPTGLGLVAGLTIAGAGLGVFMPVNNAAVMARAPRAHTGALGGVLNTTRGIGTALGVTLAGFVYGAAAHSAAAQAAAAPALAADRGLRVTLAVLGAIAACTAALAMRAGRSGGSGGDLRRGRRASLGELRLGRAGASARRPRTLVRGLPWRGPGRGQHLGRGLAPGARLQQPRAGSQQQHRAQHPAQRGRFEADVLQARREDHERDRGPDVAIGDAR